MSVATRSLETLAADDCQSAVELLPRVYDELKKLAAAKMSAESPTSTLSSTALVHEAFLRLTGDQSFANCDHFFAAAAEAMRRVLVEHARSKGRLKRGGDFEKVELVDIPGRIDEDPHLFLTLDEALSRLAEEDATASIVAKYHLLAGLTIQETAAILEVSRATAYRDWKFARAWLQDAISKNP